MQKLKLSSVYYNAINFVTFNHLSALCFDENLNASFHLIIFVFPNPDLFLLFCNSKMR